MCPPHPTPPHPHSATLTPTPVHPQVRMVPQKPGIAFVEYEDDVQATVAMQGLQGFKLATDKAMQITFARQ